MTNTALLSKRMFTSTPIEKAILEGRYHDKRRLSALSPLVLPTTPTLLLYRRALYRPERTEYAAVARIRPQQDTAVSAFVKEQAGIGRHRFLLGKGTVRAGQHRIENNVAHSAVTFATRMGNQRWLLLLS